MQIENDYDRDVYSGDIGMIEDIDFDERTVTFAFAKLDTLVLKGQSQRRNQPAEMHLQPVRSRERCDKNDRLSPFKRDMQ